MKILALNGSPRKKGATARLLEAFCHAAAKNGHQAEVVHLGEMKINHCLSCNACQEKKVEYCVHKDDLTKFFPTLFSADMLVFGSPVYFGQISGQLKVFIDRLFTCIADHSTFSIRFIDGKKVGAILTSGSPAPVNAYITEYLKYWLGTFMKMKWVGGIRIGDLMTDKALDAKPEAIRRPEKLAEVLQGGARSRSTHAAGDAPEKSATTRDLVRRKKKLLAAKKAKAALKAEKAGKSEKARKAERVGKSGAKTKAGGTAKTKKGAKPAAPKRILH